MPSQLWTLCFKPGDRYTIEVDGILYLKQASLIGDKLKNGKTTLKVKTKKFTFTLCTLSTKTVEHQALSHQFIFEDQATLIVQGTNCVQLTGMIADVDPLSDDENGSDSSDEEEQAQRLIKALNAKSAKKAKHRVNFVDAESTDDDDESDADYADEDDLELEDRETITGQPRYANYLSDLLGPDLPDDDDEEDDDDDEDYMFMDEDSDEFGTLAFRDPTDNEFLGGFELRHFNLAPDVPGFKKVDLRSQEDSIQDTQLNDNIARGLVNALLNSGDAFQVKEGKRILQKEGS
ncbi:hypothetical protein BDF20DRAFT_305550 [Mycotypha africana]|uniref:uncharacterized protein n=1 Tax=Mycotypha africana TaxID=64632 RepID=UPI00230030AB|nr:uncharacterized protein BDF20DRAFT_305550 [Mycotypha africana]KAI8988095.1 hypothetical protein BDF20DRAFT_305550 [Mycotypha africana]